MMMKARMQQMQTMQTMRNTSINQSQLGQQAQMKPQSSAMGSAYDDLPIQDPTDLEFMSHKAPYASEFESACRSGPVSVIETAIQSEIRTPAFLHNGLTIALSAGNVEAASSLIRHGAPIVRHTADNVLLAPRDCQIPLFDLLYQNGWGPNKPGFYGAVLLPRVTSDIRLLSWFLSRGADPNLGTQRDNRDRNGESETNSCDALQSAAARGTEEAVKMLLDAGAKISNGTPLHCAAGVCPAGSNPHAAAVIPSNEFDTGRVPIMRLLVERGADVNQRVESRHMTPQYPIVCAVMAGATERARWLVDHGADPHVRGSFGSAIDYARGLGTEEMKKLLEIKT